MQNRKIIFSSFVFLIVFALLSYHAFSVSATTLGDDVDVTGELTVANNVGIGTVHPKAKLDIISNLGSTTANPEGLPALNIKTISVIPTSAPDGIAFENDQASSKGFPRFGAGLMYDGTFRIQRIHPDKFDLVITKDGKVGIGTVNPLSKFDINEATATNVDMGLIARGGNALNSDIFFGVKNSGGADAGASIGSDGALGGGLSLAGNTGGSGTPDVYISTVGNLGIGTTNPTGKLDVNDSTIRVRTAKTPVSSSAACDQGEIAWDTNFIYTCVATNSWKRAALSTW